MAVMPQQKPGRSKQDYQTPPELIEAVKKLLGIREFDCDLAASPDCAYADTFLTPDTDALQFPTWKFGNGWNWLNPPFAKIEPWVRRAYEECEGIERVQTAMLVPAGVGSNWWRDWVHGKALVLFISPRLTFVGEKDPYPKDCALLLYGRMDPDTDMYRCWSWK